MKCINGIAASLSMAVILVFGCSKSTEDKPTAADKKVAASPPAQAEHAHGAGPNGGIVFDLGSHHAEFTVDHDKQQVTILFLGDDEKTPLPIAANSFVLGINETKTADGKVVPAMAVDMQPVDATDGKAAKFVGADPGIANVADFAGTVSGEIDSKPAMGQFDEAAGGHPHTTHDGVVAALNGGEGFVELKLHEDKGDLEFILPAAQESLDLTRRMYGAGEANYTTLLTAQRTYSQTQLNNLDTVRVLRIAEAEIDGLLLRGSLQVPDSGDGLRDRAYDSQSVGGPELFGR